MEALTTSWLLRCSELEAEAAGRQDKLRHLKRTCQAYQSQQLHNSETLQGCSVLLLKAQIQKLNLSLKVQESLQHADLLCDKSSRGTAQQDLPTSCSISNVEDANIDQEQQKMANHSAILSAHHKNLLAGFKKTTEQLLQVQHQMQAAQDRASKLQGHILQRKMRHTKLQTELHEIEWSISNAAQETEQQRAGCAQQLGEIQARLNSVKDSINVQQGQIVNVEQQQLFSTKTLQQRSSAKQMLRALDAELSTKIEEAKNKLAYLAG
ncbi:hypothetical protein WJX74_007604 [Apatococcus lobatus]|uniref:Uncharacterized protein n=1 Tax=Apatococcus lobatus TaxID=904363 RepID=A0AAW1RZ90_9CHLO